MIKHPSDPNSTNQSTIHDSSTKGYINPKIVQGVAFFTILICLFGSALVEIPTTWEVAGRQTMERTIASVGIIATTAPGFSWINTLFAPNDLTTVQKEKTEGPSM